METSYNELRIKTNEERNQKDVQYSKPSMNVRYTIPPVFRNRLDIEDLLDCILRVKCGKEWYGISCFFSLKKQTVKGPSYLM